MIEKSLKYFLFALAHLMLSFLILSCSTPNKVIKQNHGEFCKDKFSESAIVVLQTKSESINNGQGVIDYYSGFVCAYEVESAKSKCMVGTRLTMGRNGSFFCDSEEYPLKELCQNGELYKYFENNERIFKKHCK